MKTDTRVLVSAALAVVSSSAHAVESYSGGGVLFAIGFGTGLGAGLLWCWWRCRQKKGKDDPPPLK
ncbi:MAG TPA: hypothetical protein VGP22_11445 [Albitalea sp.]|jgi:hypothetical protein|nr:hypothetical protein [Albitalea sp.]